MAHLQEERIKARQLRVEGKALHEIAEMFGVSLSTASLWVRGVLPSGKQAADPRKSEVLPILARMYREGHPISVIAKITGVPQGTLFDWRRKLELPKNKRTIYVTHELRTRISKSLSRDPDGVHKRDAARLYIEEQLSTLEIAKIIGVTPQSVGEWLKAMGVPIRTAVTLRTRQKLKAASTGEKRWNWKGGITKERVRLRTNLEMKLAREACFQRDDYTCRSCGQRGGKLNAHHVWPFQSFPEWMYETWNLITLCRNCHDGFHKAAGGHVKLAIGPFPGFVRQEEVKEAAAGYSVYSGKNRGNVDIRNSSKVFATLKQFSAHLQFFG